MHPTQEPANDTESLTCSWACRSYWHCWMREMECIRWSVGYSFISPQRSLNLNVYSRFLILTYPAGLQIWDCSDLSTIPSKCMSWHFLVCLFINIYWSSLLVCRKSLQDWCPEPISLSSMVPLRVGQTAVSLDPFLVTTNLFSITTDSFLTVHANSFSTVTDWFFYYIKWICLCFSVKARSGPGLAWTLWPGSTEVQVQVQVQHMATWIGCSTGTGILHSVTVMGCTGMGMVLEFLTRGHTATHTCGVTGFLRVFNYYYFYFKQLILCFNPIFYYYLSITYFHSIMSHCDKPHHPAFWPLQHNTRTTTDCSDHQTTLYDKGCQNENE